MDLRKAYDIIHYLTTYSQSELDDQEFLKDLPRYGIFGYWLTKRDVLNIYLKTHSLSKIRGLERVFYKAIKEGFNKVYFHKNKWIFNY